MSQPKWKIAHDIGDTPPDYDGMWVYVDQTGVYDPELVYLETPPDDEWPFEEHAEAKWRLYRVALEQCTYTVPAGPCNHPQGCRGGCGEAAERGQPVLSENESHPGSDAWFADDIESVASCMDYPAEELRSDLCSEDALKRAPAYRAIAEYFGWENFDSYPFEMDLAETEKWLAEQPERIES